MLKWSDGLEDWTVLILLGTFIEEKSVSEYFTGISGSTNQPTNPYFATFLLKMHLFFRVFPGCPTCLTYSVPVVHKWFVQLVGGLNKPCFATYYWRTIHFRGFPGWPTHLTCSSLTVLKWLVGSAYQPTLIFGPFIKRKSISEYFILFWTVSAKHLRNNLVSRWQSHTRRNEIPTVSTGCAGRWQGSEYGRMQSWLVMGCGGGKKI